MANELGSSGALGRRRELRVRGSAFLTSNAALLVTPRKSDDFSVCPSLPATQGAGGDLPIEGYIADTECQDYHLHGVPGDDEQRRVMCLMSDTDWWAPSKAAQALRGGFEVLYGGYLAAAKLSLPVCIFTLRTPDPFPYDR